MHCSILWHNPFHGTDLAFQTGSAAHRADGRGGGAAAGLAILAGHLDGAQVKIQQSVDPSKKDYLQAVFYTNAAMTRIHSFYEDLLQTNDYRVVTAGLETGHTVSGTSQNAWGHVEADN